MGEEEPILGDDINKSAGVVTLKGHVACLPMMGMVEKEG
jgi:hypothetical protein